MNPRIPSEREIQLDKELSIAKRELRQLKREKLGLEPYDSSHCKTAHEHLAYNFDQLMLEVILERPLTLPNFIKD